MGLIIAYIMVGVVLAGIVHGITDDPDPTMFFLLLWPLAIPVVAIMAISYFTNRIKLKFFN